MNRHFVIYQFCVDQSFLTFRIILLCSFASYVSKATGARGKELKLPPSTVGRGPSSKASIPSTAITDDSSADDKSSVSSKTESLGSVPIIAAVAPSWGGGKTFADVLKKKEQAAPSTQKK